MIWASEYSFIAVFLHQAWRTSVICAAFCVLLLLSQICCVMISSFSTDLTKNWRLWIWEPLRKGPNARCNMAVQNKSTRIKSVRSILCSTKKCRVKTPPSFSASGSVPCQQHDCDGHCEDEPSQFVHPSCVSTKKLQKLRSGQRKPLTVFGLSLTANLPSCLFHGLTSIITLFLSFCLAPRRQTLAFPKTCSFLTLVRPSDHIFEKTIKRTVESSNEGHAARDMNQRH